MKEKQLQNNFHLLSIVAIVAIVGIVIFVSSTNSQIFSDQDYVGEALKASSLKTAPFALGSCSDTDSGFDYTTKGIISGGKWKTTGKTYTAKTDSCNVRGQVQEGFCTSSTEAFYVFKYCEDVVGEGYVCEDGACAMKISILEIEDAEIASNKITYAITFENEGTTDVEYIEVNCNLYVYNSGFETLYDEDVTETIDIPAGETTTVYCTFDTTETEPEGSLLNKVAEEHMEVRAKLTVGVADIEETHSEEWTENSFSFIPNVAILEFQEDDSCRYSNGNLKGECVVEEFYSVYTDDFDMLLITDVGEYNELYNGYSGGSVHRYVPTNIGEIDNCDGTPIAGTVCDTYPERLRYMQQIGDAITNGRYLYGTFTHEVGHYWGVSWRSSSSYDSCFDEPWMEQTWENSHWTELLQAGADQSTLSYLLNSVSEGDTTGIAWGPWFDNGDGTFTKVPNGGYDYLYYFNYIDLYTMGLMSEEEIATKEMYVLLDPVYIEKNLYSGTRYDLTLDTFKEVLKVREECEGTGTEYYYIGDGSRQLHTYDGGIEFAEDFRIAIILIKFPEQEISDEEAYEICEAVNYNLPSAWNEGTWGLSEIDLRLEEGSSLPDCSELYE